MTKEALTQLREVHAIQGRDGCWDIDDYMLGLYNGLELALSIVENRACKYKQRPKSQPEQEPVAWVWRAFDPDVGHYGEWSSWKLSDYKPPRQPSQWFQVVSLPSSTPPHRKPLTGWQPIETAPRDGTEILMTNGVDVSSGQWFSEYGGTYDQEGAPNGDERDAGWMDWIGGMQPDPTHWMPLPPPPTEAAHGIKE